MRIPTPTTPAHAETLRQELRVQLRLAWPVVLGMIGMMGMGVVDTVMVGAFGGEALAGVALAVTWCWGVAVVARNAAKGLDPLVSQAFGAGERQGAGRALVHGLVMALLLSLPVAVAHLFAARGLALLGQPLKLLPLAQSYATILAPGVPAMLVGVVVQQFLQNLGVVKPATVAVLLANAVNLVLDWVLMRGLGSWPGLGPVGCAWASLFSQLFLLLVLCWLARDVLRSWWPADWRVQARDLRGVREILSLGLPVGLQIAIETWGFQFAGVMVGWLGETQLAAHTVALNLATFTFMTPLGISAAAATRVGNLVGAGRPWGRAAIASLGMGATFMALSAVALRLLPHELALVYTRDPTVVSLAAVLIPVAGAFQLVDGIQVVGFGILRGLADLRVPALVNVVVWWFLGMPLAWTLAFRMEMGARGIWIGLACSLGLVATVLLLRIGWLHHRGVRALPLRSLPPGAPARPPPGR